jgi:hypothetical protein
MECWSNGVLGKKQKGLVRFHHSNTPILHDSSTPFTLALQHSILLEGYFINTENRQEHGNDNETDDQSHEKDEHGFQ